jgi:cytochrome P450
MKTVTVESYRDVANALRNRFLVQALYDEGGVVMEDVLLTLHGDAHRDRRRLENRVFRREIFRSYEREIFPPTIAKTLEPHAAAGRADLVELGYRITMNLTADFAGIDRPEETPAETEALLELVRKFSEGATLVHSRRDKAEVRSEVREALDAFEERFLLPSIARRRALLERFAAGQLAAASLPRDVLTVLLRNEDRLPLPFAVLRREMAFYLQAGAHSTANSATHAVHEIFAWCAARQEDARRLAGDPLFLQRCVHESLRLHPASPVAWRRPECPVHLERDDGGDRVDTGDKVVIDMLQANRDPAVFGEDASRFNPHRELPRDVMPFGLTFGKGMHACLGQDLDGGLVPKGDVDPETHLYGTVTLIVRMLLEAGARPDPEQPPERDARTERPNWGRYPILFSQGEATA